MNQSSFSFSQQEFSTFPTYQLTTLAQNNTQTPMQLTSSQRQVTRLLVNVTHARSLTTVTCAKLLDFSSLYRGQYPNPNSCNYTIAPNPLGFDTWCVSPLGREVAVTLTQLNLHLSLIPTQTLNPNLIQPPFPILNVLTLMLTLIHSAL